MTIPQITFATDLTTIKANVKTLRECLDRNKAESKVLYAMLHAVYDCCPHASKFSTYDGWTCNDCGKQT